MSTPTKLAFAHPEARAIASAADQSLDRISLRDHVVSVEIGAFQAERGITQRLSFNIVVEVKHASADLGDDVDLILSYDRVTEAIDIELAAERLNLLETLAERIADRILSEPQAERVFVRIEKLDRGGGALGVEIERRPGDADQSRERSEAVAPQPRVVVFGDAALQSDLLTSWVQQLSALGAPLVLCVPKAASPSPVARKTLAQNRIELLAIEQNAWALSALIEGAAVVGTRTELDWAIKHDQVSIWAPSKFVFDAVDGPMDLIGDPVALAFWLAKQINACEIVVVGVDGSVAADIPVRTLALSQERI